MPYRVGIGYDIHRLVEGRPLILGGITIPYNKGLLGHSDGDVIVHAIGDAILGAIAHGDIGEMYPDTSRQTEGMDSIKILKEIMDTIAGEYELLNVDVNCICERPKLAGYRSGMINTIASALGVIHSIVSVKFRTNEGLGDVGEERAIAAQAVVMLKRR
ncbi:MAG TPA: 2-C-methyl-D-erythritol 2,4-cyclodiphosphate synthase [Desulfomonilia bacterium]|nr:2-C-methyl-D-erythritol 2,4-cyclodiphosphate synthase [Desulfomonilia bacterium]